MLLQIHKLERYKDDHGNEIIYDGEPLEEKIDIRFKGSNNTLTVGSGADIKDLLVTFYGDNGRIEIGPTTEKRLGLRFEVRCGHDSQVWIGPNVGCRGRVLVSAVEGVSVTIGEDVMFAKNVEVRGDDTHPIYDVRTKKRINASQSIVVGEHVWVAKHAVIMGGTTIGNGSVVGFRSIVTSSLPNNCIAVGAPARVVKRHIAWEHPMVMPRRSDEIHPRKGEKSDRYWNLTDETAPLHPPVKPALPRPKSPAARTAAKGEAVARRLPGPVRRIAKKLRSS